MSNSNRDVAPCWFKDVVSIYGEDKYGAEGEAEAVVL